MYKLAYTERFKKAFNNRLNNLIISSDCIFDNVKGFKKIGEKLWR